MTDQRKPATSPLERIKNLREIDSQKMADLQNRMRTKYVTRMTEYLRESRLRAERIQDKVIY